MVVDKLRDEEDDLFKFVPEVNFDTGTIGSNVSGFEEFKSLSVVRNKLTTTNDRRC